VPNTAAVEVNAIMLRRQLHQTNHRRVDDLRGAQWSSGSATASTFRTAWTQAAVKVGGDCKKNTEK